MQVPLVGSTRAWGSVIWPDSCRESALVWSSLVYRYRPGRCQQSSWRYSQLAVGPVSSFGTPPRWLHMRHGQCPLLVPVCVPRALRWGCSPARRLVFDVASPSFPLVAKLTRQTKQIALTKTQMHAVESVSPAAACPWQRRILPGVPSRDVHICCFERI